MTSEIVLALHEIARWQQASELQYPDAAELQEVIDGMTLDEARVIDVAENVRSWMNEKNLTFSGHGRYLSEVLDHYHAIAV